MKVTEDRPITVKVSGAGELLALGSAKPNMGETFVSDTHTTYYGKALAVIRAGSETGDIRVSVVSSDLKEQSLTIQVK